MIDFHAKAREYTTLLVTGFRATRSPGTVAGRELTGRGGPHDFGGSVNRPNPAQLAMARRLLAHEAGEDGPHQAATTAARVYDKVNAHLSPLVGVAGVQLLFGRSAKLVQREFPFLAEVTNFEGSTQLRACFQAQDPTVATDSAAALFGTFFAIITNFIGERLTLQIIRSAWPAIEETAPAMAPTENKK